MKGHTKVSTLALLLLMLIIRQADAQFSHLLKLPAHTDAAKVSWWDSIYRFPDFQYGRVTFATGFSPLDKLKLNYNLYFGAMDLITENGDTVQLKITKELKLVDIAGHLFYCDKQGRFIEVLVQSPIALGVWSFLNTEQLVFVSGSIGGSAGVDTRGIPSVYDRYYKKKGTYFFIDKKNQLYKAIKPSLMKLFRGHKKKINAYLQENEIDFNKEEDLVKILSFCSQLDQS